MWAAFFWKSGHLTSLDDGWYFACASHTALGYGDVVLTKPWRSLGPICAINGLLNFGCSTAALFLVLQGLAPPPIRGRLMMLADTPPRAIASKHHLDCPFLAPKEAFAASIACNTMLQPFCL